MAHKASKRILREINDFSKTQESCGMKLDLKENSKTEIRGEILGPKGTLYEGGRFVLDISLPENYPSRPPVIKFVTKIWHPNIDSETGDISNDILSHSWSSVWTLRSVMLSLKSLLAAPEISNDVDDDDDDVDDFVAEQYKDRYEVFEKTARHWTNVYAGGPNREPWIEQTIENMKELGFEEDESRIVLSKYDWVVYDAITFFQNQENFD